MYFFFGARCWPDIFISNHELFFYLSGIVCLLTVLLVLPHLLTLLLFILFSENGAECEAVIDKAVPLTAGVYKKTPVDIVQQTDPDEHEPGNIIEELQSPHFTDIQSTANGAAEGEGTSEMQQIDVPIDTVKPFQSVADNQRKYYPKRTRV